MPFPLPVESLLRELSALPYENLSKIVAYHRLGAEARSRELALVTASDWLDTTRASGAGGTCFSLTWWLQRRLRALGFETAFLMGDKGRDRNIHCGLRLDWEGRGYLLDPGYMIFAPLPLPEAGLASVTWVSPNEVRVEDLPGGEAWRLFSGPKGAPKARFDFRRRAVTEAEFLAHWEASYGWSMMDYPVLNRLKDGVQYYLQKRSLLVRSPAGGEMRKLSQAEMMEALTVTFGIPEELAREALGIVAGRTADFFRR